MIKKVLEKEKKKAGFDDLKTIEEFQNKEVLDKEEEMEEWLNTDKQTSASELDLALLSVLVADRINASKSVIPSI